MGIIRISAAFSATGQPVRLLLMLLACLAAHGACAQTFVRGAIAVDTRWALASSPVVVSDTVVIQGGATLTIEAGVTVYMAADTSVRVESGSIRAIGTSTQRIRVMSDRMRTGGAAAPGDWANWAFDPGTTNTELSHVDLEHGNGLLIKGSAPALNHLSIRNQLGPAITMDLAASAYGVGNTAGANGLNGILVPAGDITGRVRWGVRGIPYVVASGTVSVGASPTISSVSPATLEQGSTWTLTVDGGRLAGLAQATLDGSGLGVTPFPGGSDTQVFLRVRADARAALGPATLRLLVDAGEVILPNAITVTAPQPFVSSVQPSSIEAGAGETELIVTGRNFGAGAEVLVNSVSLPTTVVSDTELRGRLPNQTLPGSLQLQVRVPNTAAGGTPLLSGSFALSVQAPVPPTVAIEPTPIAMPPDAKAREVTLRLSKPDYRDHTFAVSVADPSKATAEPASLVIRAGQTSARIAITPKAGGTTSLVLDSATLPRLSVPLFITADFRGASTAHAAAVGVLIEQVPEQKTRPITLTHSTVGVAVGGVLSRLVPSAMTAASTGTLIIQGSGIPPGATLRLVPDIGIALGAPSVNASGTELAATATVSADAPLEARRVMVFDAAGQHLAFADPARGTLLLFGALPSIDGIEPLFSARGKTIRMVVRGKNLQQGQLHMLPATGLSIDSAPVVSSDGGTLTAWVSVAADAPTGLRLVKVITPAGASSDTASPANTFTVAASVGNQVTPITSQAVGVLVQKVEAEPARVQVQPLSSAVGVLVGAGVADMSPRTLVVGTEVAITVRGQGLQAATAVSLVPAEGLSVAGALAVNATGTELRFTLRVDGAAALGLRQLSLKAGDQPLPWVQANDGSFLVSTPVPELTSVTPQVVAAGQSAIKITVRGSNLRNISGVRLEPATGVSVRGPFDTSGDADQLSFSISVAANEPSSDRTVVVISAAGESTSQRQPGNQLRVAQVVGPTYSHLASPSVGVVVGADLPPPIPRTSTVAAQQVGVVVLQAAGPAETTNTLQVSPPVGVLLGPVVQALSPSGLLRGASATLTLVGTELNSVAAITATPATGLLLGNPIVSNNSTRLQITISAAPDAPDGLRRLRLFTADGTELPFATTEAAQFGIGSLPVLASLAPLTVEQGKSVNVVVRGSGLKAVLSAAFEPAAGMHVAGPVVWSQDALGETLSVPVRVDATAATGARVLRLQVYGGITSAVASPANTVTVIPPQ